MTAPENQAETGDSLDVRAVARRLAEREGVTVSDLLSIALETLLARAADGDAVAARALLDRLSPPSKDVGTWGFAKLVEDSYEGDKQPAGPVVTNGVQTVRLVSGVPPREVDDAD